MLSPPKALKWALAPGPDFLLLWVVKPGAPLSPREMGSLPRAEPCPRPGAPLTSSPFGFTSVLRKGHGFNEQFIPGLAAGQAPGRQGAQFGSLLSDPLKAPCALALYNVFSSQHQLSQEVGYVWWVLLGVFSSRSSRV